MYLTIIKKYIIIKPSKERGKQNGNYQKSNLCQTDRGGTETLCDAYDILNELYDIIADNDCGYVDDTSGNDYDRPDVALTANVLQMLATAEKVEIRN